MGDRRPDAAGIWSHKQIALAHRRLKIIDLTETGAQPMVDAALGITVVFNGCIYNYKELRAELQAAGYRFFSTTHTEVIGKAYKAWGDNFVDRLIGMFAICIYEQDTGRTVLLRDRLGIKPMYLSDRPGRMRFASTLPGLLAGGEVGWTSVVGLDLMVPRVDGPEFYIIEANERPGLANHELQPTAARFIDLLFPATRQLH